SVLRNRGPACTLGVKLLSPCSERWSLHRFAVDVQTGSIRRRFAPGAEIRRRDLLVIRDRHDQERAGGLDPAPQVAPARLVRRELELVDSPGLDLGEGPRAQWVDGLECILAESARGLCVELQAHQEVGLWIDRLCE